MTGFSRLACLAAIVLLGGWEYASIRSAGFVHEDAIWTTACAKGFDVAERVTSLRGFPRTGALLSWCWQLHQGDTLFGFHLLNMALHGLCAFLLGVLVWQVTGVESVAWAVGALFFVHPMSIESAVYLAGRGELIAGVGVLLACVAAMEREYLAMLAAVTLGLLGKETAIVAVVAVPLALSVRGRLGAWLAAAVSVALTAVIVALTLAVNMIHLSLAQRIVWALLQATAWVRMVALMVIPYGQTPTHDYGGIGLFWMIVALASMAGVYVYGWRKRDDAPLLAAGLWWLVLTALPRLVVPTPPSYLNEHQFYVPSIGAFLILAHLLLRLSPSRGMLEASA